MNDEQFSRFKDCINQQKFDAAFNVCNEAIRENASDWNAIYLAGVALRYRSDFSGAIDYYRRALKLNPESAPIWQALGIALQSIRRFSEAIDSLSTAIQIDPDSYAAHNSLGLTYKLAGDYVLAMRSYEDALQVRANHAYAEVRRDHPELFRIEQQGDSRVLHIDRACLEHTRQILVTDFDYFNTVKNMVTCCVEMGDHDRARELQEHAETCTPIDADIMGPFNRNAGDTDHEV